MTDDDDKTPTKEPDKQPPPPPVDRDGVKGGVPPERKSLAH